MCVVTAIVDIFINYKNVNCQSFYLFDFITSTYETERQQSKFNDKIYVLLIGSISVNESIILVNTYFQFCNSYFTNK